MWPNLNLDLFFVYCMLYIVKYPVMSMLPTDVLVAIGMTCWRAYKALFLANRAVNAELSKVRIKDVFYAERRNREFPAEEYEYYKYVLDKSDIQIEVYFDGVLRRDYNLLIGWMLTREATTYSIYKILRYRWYGERRFGEELCYINPNNIFVIRSCKFRNYLETHTFALEPVQGLACIKYICRRGPGDDIDDTWRIHTPTGDFYHSDFEIVEN